MAKRKSKTVTIKLNKDGTMTFRSTGGVDLRKVVPSLFQSLEDDVSPAAPTSSEEKHNG